MKNILYSVITLTVISIAASCNCSKHQKSKSAESASAPALFELNLARVTDIQPGKDGYTATVTAPDQKIYFVTISHSNLKDPGQYRTVNKDETISLKGDLWKMDDQNRITVRELSATIVDDGNCYEGKLILSGICKQRAIVLTSPNTGKLPVQATWTNSNDGKVYKNVFNVKNICDFPDNIKEGDVLTFKVVAPKKSECMVCLAYVPVPDSSLFIQVGCRKN